MKKYLLIALMASGLLMGCSNSNAPAAASTTAPVTPTTMDPATPTAPTTVLITTSVVPPPQSGSAVLRPVLQILKSASEAPAELPAGAAVLSSKDGEAYLTGNVLAEGNIFADAEAIQQADGSHSLTATLREGSQGVDVFNAAAAGCVKKVATCPTGVIAVVVNGTLVGTATVRGPASTPTLYLRGSLSKDTANAYVRLITGRE